MDTTPSAAPTTRAYFRSTTASQRRLLFNTAEQIGNVSEAARRAHVSRGTFYYWQPRYTAEGTAGLTAERSRAPHHTRIAPVSAELHAEVLRYHAAHPGAGYRTIANELCKAHQWQKVISYTKVREIILAQRATPPAPIPPTVPPAAGFHSPAVAVHAPEPDQTVNIDLCVVPLTHDGQPDLISVRLSTALAGVPPADEPCPPPAPDCPGQVFEEATLSYREQMHCYATQRTAKRLSKGQRKHRRRHKQAERAEVRAQQDELRLQRRRQRLQRRQEDADWQAARQSRRESQRVERQRSKAEHRTRRAERQAQEQHWHATKAARRAQQQQRQQEDAAWRQARQQLTEQLATLLATAPLVTAWLAILVVVDNGTRRCLGVPLFTAGVHVTAEMVVTALRPLCPPGLEFLISDNGSQFIAEDFAALAQAQGFVHVRIAPRRACTNGIAERFVRTLKEWLAAHAWQGPEELAILLTEFLEYYNERPHQGAELDGLSPNEFTRRLAK